MGRLVAYEEGGQDKGVVDGSGVPSAPVNRGWKVGVACGLVVVEDC